MDTKKILQFMEELNFKAIHDFQNGNKDRWLRYQQIIKLLEDELQELHHTLKEVKKRKGK